MSQSLKTQHATEPGLNMSENFLGQGDSLKSMRSETANELFAYKSV